MSPLQLSVGFPWELLLGFLGAKPRVIMCFFCWIPLEPAGACWSPVAAVGALRRPISWLEFVQHVSSLDPFGVIWSSWGPYGGLIQGYAFHYRLTPKRNSASWQVPTLLQFMMLLMLSRTRALVRQLRQKQCLSNLRLVRLLPQLGQKLSPSRVALRLTPRSCLRVALRLTPRSRLRGALRLTLRSCLWVTLLHQLVQQKAILLHQLAPQ